MARCHRCSHSHCGIVIMTLAPPAAICLPSTSHSYRPLQHSQPGSTSAHRSNLPPRLPCGQLRPLCHDIQEPRADNAHCRSAGRREGAGSVLHLSRQDRPGLTCERAASRQPLPQEQLQYPGPSCLWRVLICICCTAHEIHNPATNLEHQCGCHQLTAPSSPQSQGLSSCPASPPSDA